MHFQIDDVNQTKTIDIPFPESCESGPEEFFQLEVCDDTIDISDFIHYDYTEELYRF